jgi:hypothetical protein
MTGFPSLIIRNAPHSFRLCVCRRRCGVCAGGPALRLPPRLGCVWYGPRPPAVPRSDRNVVYLIEVRTAALRANSAAVYIRVVVRAAGAPPGGDTVDEVHTVLFAVRTRVGGGAGGIGGGRMPCASQATTQEDTTTLPRRNAHAKRMYRGASQGRVAIAGCGLEQSGSRCTRGWDTGITGEPLDVPGPM